MSINLQKGIETCIENAARSVDSTCGTHPNDEVKAHALTSIANSLLAIAVMMYRDRSRFDFGGKDAKA